MNRLTAIGAAAIVGVFAMLAAAGEPEQPGDRQPSAQREQPEGRRLMRMMVERRLEQARRQQERMQKALELLDGGTSPEQVREQFPDLAPPRGRGPDDGFGPGPEDGEPLDGPGPRGRPGGPRPGGDELGPAGPRERPAALDRPLTDDERAVMREFLRTAQPRLHEMFLRLENEDPAEARRKLTEMYPRLRPLLELRERDPKMYELRINDLRHGREAMDAAQWLVASEQPGGQGGETERRQRVRALRAALGAQFDARTEITRLELAHQGERIERARADLERRVAERETSLEAYMARMLERERERLRRGDDSDRPPPPPGPDTGRRRRGGP